MMTPGQKSLANFYTSVKFDNPRMAALIHNDVMTVAMYALAADNTYAQDAADRLREKALDLPEIQKRVLDNALTDLGYARR